MLGCEQFVDVLPVLSAYEGGGQGGSIIPKQHCEIMVQALLLFYMLCDIAHVIAKRGSCGLMLQYCNGAFFRKSETCSCHCVRIGNS